MKKVESLPEIPEVIRPSWSGRREALPSLHGSPVPSGELNTIAALTQLYRKLSPDLVHHVTAKPILYGGIAARIARVPAVVHAVSGLGYVFISEEPRARMLRRAIRTTALLIRSRSLARAVNHA